MTADSSALQRETLQRVFGRVIVLRLFLAPVLVVVLAWAVWLDPVAWRVALGSAAGTVLALLTLVEYLRLKTDTLGPLALPANAFGMFLIQLAAVAVTGGIDSPVLVVVPLAAFMAGVLLGESAARALTVGAQLAALWTMAGLVAAGVPLSLPQIRPMGHGAAWPWVVAVCVTLVLLVATTVGGKLREMLAATVERALAASERERQAHAEHARELVTLSAEIAHELKNPLASVKGLAALLAKDVDGRSAERLAVLRAEVDRMQETLEQFLDFSRPLAPVARAPVDLAALGADVVALCEGVARARGVTVEPPVEPVALSGDGRKLRQLLVNLVQNAIEASPPGAKIEIAAVPGQPVVLEVRDRGPGPPPGVDPFAAGVTTKAKGSGLGLTIARALVQQHGGELLLLPREGGGAVARVVLPSGHHPV